MARVNGNEQLRSHTASDGRPLAEGYERIVFPRQQHPCAAGRLDLSFDGMLDHIESNIIQNNNPLYNIWKKFISIRAK